MLDQALRFSGGGHVLIALYYIVGFIFSFWWVFVLIWIGYAILSALSSRGGNRDELLAENNRLLAELIDEKKRNKGRRD